MGKDFEDQLGEVEGWELDASVEDRRVEIEEHAKDYANNYNDQTLMGSGKGLEDLGLQPDSVAATSSNGLNTISKNEKKRFHDLLKLIERIDWLNEQIERLGDKIKSIEEDIATKEDLLEALAEGRELTPEQQKLAAQYLDENGEIDVHALFVDIEREKLRLEELKSKVGEYEAELSELKKEETAVKWKFQNEQELSHEEAIAVFGSSENFDADELDAAIDDFAGGDSEFGEFMKDKLVSLDQNSSAFANEIAESSIKVDSVKGEFNAAASNQEPSPSLTEEPAIDRTPVAGYTR